MTGDLVDFANRLTTGRPLRPDPWSPTWGEGFIPDEAEGLASKQHDRDVRFQAIGSKLDPQLDPDRTLRYTLKDALR